MERRRHYVATVSIGCCVTITLLSALNLAKMFNFIYVRVWSVQSLLVTMSVLGKPYCSWIVTF